MHGEKPIKAQENTLPWVRIILMILIGKSISSRWIFEIILNESRKNNKKKINVSMDVYKHVKRNLHLF